MPLLSVSLYPDHVMFDGPGYEQKHAINGTRNLFAVSHGHGNLSIEVKNRKLLIGWEPTDELTPNTTVSTSYHRVDDLFYPEVLIHVTGYVTVIPRT